MPTTTLSPFADVKMASPDAILGINADFRADASPKKVNLAVGAYRTSTGDPYVLPLVRRIEQKLASDTSVDHEYLPQDGLSSFCKAAARLIFGKDSVPIRENRVVTVQSLSGTGALRLAFDFLASHVPSVRTVYISTPSYPNHRAILDAAGLNVATFRYFDSSKRALDLTGMLDDLRAAPDGSVVVLHACAHNPTGADPSKEQWQAICDVVKSRSIIPLFDCAYQGFASGDLDEDAYAIRLFAAENIDMFVAQSFAKNMGLYGERVGALSVVSRVTDSLPAVRSQLKKIARANYSSPPLHGARVAAEVLSDESLMREWKTELTGMSGRIKKMRTMLKDALVKHECPGSWSHILEQIGMFSYTGLSTPQVRYMRQKFHVYLTDNGRMSMAGLTEDTVDHVANAMTQAVRALPQD